LKADEYMEFDLTDAHPALLIIDLQELFSSADGPFKNTSADELFANVNTFTNYCHSLSLPIIYSRYLFRNDLSDAGLLSDNPFVKLGHFCEDSPWMKLDRRLDPPDSSIYLQRSRPGAFWNNSLEETLKQKNIDTLLLSGLSVNNAISATAREAFARDIPTIVVKECTGAAPFETELEIYFDILDAWTAEVATTDNIKQRLSKSS